MLDILLQRGKHRLASGVAHPLERRELPKRDWEEANADELRVQPVNMRLEARDINPPAVRRAHPRPARTAVSPGAPCAHIVRGATHCSSGVKILCSSACTHWRRFLPCAASSAHVSYRRAYGCGTLLPSPAVRTRNRVREGPDAGSRAALSSVVVTDDRGDGANALSEARESWRRGSGRCVNGELEPALGVGVSGEHILAGRGLGEGVRGGEVIGVDGRVLMGLASTGPKTSEQGLRDSEWQKSWDEGGVSSNALDDALDDVRDSTDAGEDSACPPSCSVILPQRGELATMAVDYGVVGHEVERCPGRGLFLGRAHRPGLVGEATHVNNENYSMAVRPPPDLRPDAHKLAR